MTLEEAFRELERIRYLVSIESFARQETNSAFGVALNTIMEQLKFNNAWNDTAKSTPKDTGEYLCIVEYDFDEKHQITRRLLYWDGVSWAGMGRDNDVVTYWHDSINKPNDERCSGCMWPVQWCRCETGGNE